MALSTKKVSGAKNQEHKISGVSNLKLEKGLIFHKKHSLPV